MPLANTKATKSIIIVQVCIYTCKLNHLAMNCTGLYMQVEHPEQIWVQLLLQYNTIHAPHHNTHRTGIFCTAHTTATPHRTHKRTHWAPHRITPHRTPHRITPHRPFTLAPRRTEPTTITLKVVTL